MKSSVDSSNSQSAWLLVLVTLVWFSFPIQHSNADVYDSIVGSGGRYIETPREQGRRWLMKVLGGLTSASLTNLESQLANLNQFGISTNNSINVDSSLGYHFGFAVDSGQVIGPIGIEAGLFYSKRGAAIEIVSGSDIDSGFQSRSSYRLPYLSLPVLARVYPVSIISIGVGPYVAYGLGSPSLSTSVTLSGQTQEIDSREGTWDNFNRLDYGFIASLGFRAPSSSSVAIIADVRYEFGLAEFQKDTAIKNRNLSLLIGMTF